MKDLIKQILREETKGELNNRARHLLDMMAVASLKNIADGDIESMRKALRDVEESDINWDKDVVKSVREKYKDLMLRAKEVLKEEKKKLFIPRNIDERRVQFEKKVKDVSDKFLIDNDIKSLNYSIKTQNRLGELSYLDIDDATFNGGEIILNNEGKIENRKRFYHINHSDFIEYSHIMSGYLNILIDNHSPKESKIIGLDISVESVVGKIKIDGIIVFVSYNHRYLSRNIERVNFSKTI